MQEDFKIFLQETRVYRNQDGEMIFEGTASSETLDSHRTRFNAEAQEGFQFDIMKGMEDLEPVELEAEHKGEEGPMNILGPVVFGTVSADNKLMIRAKLDSDNPQAVYYFNKMTRPDKITGKVKKFGLSINGTVEKAHYEYDQEAGTHIEVFDRVRLKRIGIVRKPSNPDCWVEKIIRSVNWDEVKKPIDTNTNDQERLTLEMQNSETQEQDANRSDIVNDADASAAAVVVADDATGVEVVNTDVDAETREQVQHEDLSDEVTKVDASDDVKCEDVDCDHSACGLTVRSESEIKDEEKVEVNRTSYWMANTLLEAMEEVVEAVTTLENVTEFDGEIINVGMSEECVVLGKSLLNKLMELFGDHVNTKRSEDEVLVVENPSDLKEDSQEEIRNEENTNEIRAVVNVSTNIDAEQVIRAVTDMLDNDFTERMVNRFEESQKSLVSAMNDRFDSLTKDNAELSRGFEEVKSENAKLVARLAEIEKMPASRPGIQILESVSRTQVDSEKKAVNLARARAEEDTKEIFNHKVFGNAYLGYGEYAKV